MIISPLLAWGNSRLRLAAPYAVALAALWLCSPAAALANALYAYASSHDSRVLDAYVQANPAAPWLASVLTNLGLLKSTRDISRPLWTFGTALGL